MENIITLFVGLLLLAMGYFIGIRQKINLVHSYHHKNVAQADKPAFCRRVGLGNAIIGAAILCVPVLRPVVGVTVALGLAGVAAVMAGALVISTIIRYNGSLF